LVVDVLHVPVGAPLESATEKLLAIIEASFGNLAPFNQLMRGMFKERLNSRTLSLLANPEGEDFKRLSQLAEEEESKRASWQALDKLASAPKENPASAPKPKENPAPAPKETLQECLTGLGLTKWLPKLLENEINSLDELRLLTEDDYKEMEIAIGPRRKILNALAQSQPEVLAC